MRSSSSPAGAPMTDEDMPVGGPDDKLPDWLLEDWPPAEMKARVERIRQQKAGRKESAAV